ncbi:MAG TPA: hypothetical protein VMR33_00490 [Candidatus Baltobacteraceae bacterium]|nr:hypothetical protein [Candidatus Baltobacteraceae bacterium]
MSNLPSRTAQSQDNYKCGRCGSERTAQRAGAVAPMRPLIYCGQCRCIRVHLLTTDGKTEVRDSRRSPLPTVHLLPTDGETEVRDSRRSPLPRVEPVTGAPLAKSADPPVK